MKQLIIYATTEGQTRKVARFCADRLCDAGDTVELLPAAEAGDVDLSRFDGVILAGSVHVGQYQDTLVDFAADHADALSGMRTLFLSVSLSAAGNDPDDWAGLEAGVARFVERTGWQPGQVAHVAGAFRFTEYDWFRTWAMRWIAHQKGQKVTPGADREYTDWEALGETLTAWRAGSGGQ